MGGGKGSNKTKSTFKLPPEFIKAYNESLGLASKAIQQPYTPYQGQLVAGMTPSQQQGLANINAAQGMALPAIQQGMGYTQQAAQGITPELYERFYSPYVRDVADTTFANLMESNAQQRSGLKSGAIQAGAFGGDRGGIAQAEMARQQNLANAKSMADIYNQGYGQAMGLAGQQVQNLGAMGQQMAGLGMGAQTSALQGAQAQMAAGAQEQATAQAQLQAAYDQWLQQQSYPFQIAQFYANIAQGLGSTAGGTSTTKAPSPSLASQILGGVGAAANIAGAIPGLSDERVKENIQPVGKLNDGQTVYRYNFKGNPQTQIGLLAQEVEGSNPNAVTEANGLKMVDYKGATDDAASMGGVVGPGDERQGFMDGGVPFGGAMGFVPQSQMMAATGSKIPQAATAASDAGLGGAEMMQPLSDQQKQGVANIAGLFQTPSLYNAGGVVGRSAHAEGGVPYMPYMGGRGFVPEGKMGSGGNKIPDAPPAYVDKGLAEDWNNIVPISAEDADALVNAAMNAKAALGPKPLKSGVGYAYAPDIYESGLQLDTSPMPNFNYRLATGGVAGRKGYMLGGTPTMEDAMAEAGLGVPVVEEDPRARLLGRESGGNYSARNKQGYVGRAQFGDARLEDARRAGAIPAGMSKEEFRLNPEAQQSAEKWHFGDINDFIDKTGLASMEGKSVDGIPVTREGMVNVAHLGGKGGLQKFLSSNGRYNPADANGTRLSDYLAMGAKSGGDNAPTIVPASDASGLGAAAGEPADADQPSKFSFKNLFASDTNPSIIEQIIGRRLSPEARAAMLNASFALMAGKSPFFGTNLGEAGKVGVQTYYNALGQKRELQKQQADIARQGYEAQTQRMGVDVQERNALRQQAALVLPIVRNLIALGQPVPPYIMQLLEGAYPEGTPEREQLGIDFSAASAVPGASSPAGQEAAATPGAVATAPLPPPAEGGVPPMPGLSPEAANIFNKLPPGQNPYKILQDAENAKIAGNAELYQSLLKQSQDMLADYKANGITMPDGTVVPMPGSQEVAARGKKLEGLATGEANQVTKYNEGISETQASLTPRTIVTDGLRSALASTETGKFSEMKADIINAAASLGLANADQIAEAEDIQVAMKYFAQGILDSGMKDKIGPQISNADLTLVAKGQGTVENLPVANRKIVGAMYGKLMYDRAKSAAFDQFVTEKGGLANVSPTDIRNWERDFAKTDPVSKYVDEGIANTPVAGELYNRDEDYLKPGYKYVHPNGRVFIYHGMKDVNGQKVQDAEWVN